MADDVFVAGGRLHMSAKSVTGILEQYGDWHAPVTIIAPPRQGAQSPHVLDLPLDTTGTSITVRVSSDPVAALKEVDAEVWTSHPAR